MAKLAKIIGMRSRKGYKKVPIALKQKVKREIKRHKA